MSVQYVAISRRDIIPSPPFTCAITAKDKPIWGRVIARPEKVERLVDLFEDTPIMSIMKERNQAFIDGQNLYMGTMNANDPWKLDLKRFRVHLAQKYNVDEAYYFLGVYDPEEQSLYDDLQRYGYILRFREHIPQMTAHKKGNVDTDIVFLIMRKLYQGEIQDGIVLVSGDGDYKTLVTFMIEEGKFKKLIAPSRQRMSSLYKKIDSSFIDILGTRDKRALLEYKSKTPRK